jgi:putative ATP-binding cassette transporter
VDKAMPEQQSQSPPEFQKKMLWHFLKLSLGFWRSETKFVAWGLGLAFIGCLFVKVGVDLVVNWWNKYFFDALQTKETQQLFYSIIIVLVLAVLSAGIAGLLQYVRMRFQLRWREWLSKTLIQRWMGERRFYQLSILDFVDNPEGRVAEDGRLSIELFVDFTGGIVNAFLSAASFIGVLWFIGGSLNVFGVEVPGYLVIAVVLYSSLTSFGMWLIGRPLIDRVEYKAAGEADFRYEMTRTRENAETIALIGGDEDERANLGRSFDEVALRWMQVATRQARMMFLNGGNNVLAPVIPLLLGAPKFLSGDLTLGELMQAAAAFTQVQTSLNWLADNSLRLADWFASARRVAQLDVAFQRLDKVSDRDSTNTINMGESDDGALHLVDLCIKQHDGTLMLADADVTIARGEKVLVKGDSGTGKSTLIRAVAGLWPWGSGSILCPRNARMAFMPQRPYLPLGSLRAYRGVAARLRAGTSGRAP